MVSDPNPKLPRDRDDDWIAIVVAFGVVGTAGVWPWLNGNSGIFQPVTLTSSPPREEGVDPNGDPNRNSEVTPFGVGSPSQLDAAPRSALGLPLHRTLGHPLVPPDTATAPSPETTPHPWPRLALPRDQAVDARPAQGDNILTVPQPTIPEPEATAVPNTLTNPIVFADVPADHWAKPYIDGLTARGILSGFPDGTFGPDQPMTRAQFAAQLAQAFEAMPAQRSPTAFQDLGADNWAYAGVNQAVILGFMEGYPGSIFQPEQTVPRVQVMAALAKGLQIPPPADAAAVLQNRPDQGEIPTWARTQTATAIAAQLVTSADNLPIQPNQPATRAEVAAMLYQSLVYLGEVPPVP